MNYPMNIWVIDKSEFESFVCSTGGKVVCIAEEVPIEISSHPAIVTAGALLPSYEAIQTELDGDFETSAAIYEYDLQQEQADNYTSIILGAGIRQIPIGIMFGDDECNFRFPLVFVDFMYKMYGMVFGVKNNTPYILEEALPFDLAKLYTRNIIDYKTFMEKHPQLPINQSVISKMAYEINPVVAKRTPEEYVRYFENIKNITCKNGGRFGPDPMVST